MQKRIMQLICIIAAAMLLAIYTTNTSSKYVMQKQIDLSIKVGDEITSYKPTTNDGLRATFTAKQSGYYAILARGGDAGRAFQEGSSGLISYTDGADGGCILGYYYLTASSKLTLCISSAGTDATYAKKAAVNGLGGKNTLDRFLGTDGKKGTETSMMSTSDASAGSGGSTVIFNGDNTQNANILLIAGGGGASATYNSGYYDSLQNGTGGKAGSNFDLTLGAAGAGSNASVNQPANGTVYFGYIGEKVTESYLGKGATASYGAAGSAGSGTTKGTNGQDFSDNSNAGNGGQGGGVAGAGGGGYAGGGGGSMAEVGAWGSKGNGGGGGGSSFVANTVKTFSNSATKNIVNAMLNQSGYVLSTPLNYRYTTANPSSSTHGYVIIMYLGTDENVITSL